MKWLVVLTGDNFTLELLCQTDSTDYFRIEKISNDFLLSSKSFETFSSNSEVINLTSEYLETLNGMLFLQHDIPKAIQIGPVYRINEKDGRDVFVTTKTANLIMRVCEPTITIERIDGETIVNRPGQKILEKLLKFQGEEPVKKIFRLIQNGNWEFADVYKIVEIIQSNNPSEFYNWASKEKIKLLKWTANHDKAIGDKARHGVMPTDPPKEPMDIAEARAITRTLIENYLLSITRI